MTNYLLTIGLFSLIFHVPAVAGTDADASSSSGTVVAEVDGTKFTLADLERRHPASLFQARNTFYQAERKAIEDFIDDYLLERQAQKENVTVSQLLDRHVISALPKDPPDEALRVYFEGLDSTQPYEAVRDQIVESLRQRRLGKARAAYLKTLRSQANLVVSLGPPRAQISLKDTPIRGLAEAPVLLVEFADYECPFCQQIQPSLDKLQAEYKGKLAFVYKDAPLPMHPHAEKAAEATHCAGKQGKYWEYHDLLYISKQLEVPQLQEHARKLGLDGAAFDKCLESGEQAAIVNAQFAESQSLQLQGTPSFFVNGHFFSGGLTYEQFRGVVEEELALSSARANTTTSQLSRDGTKSIGK
jgi:protein-disulfide isomerase